MIMAEAPKMEPGLTVVVPVYNEAETLVHFLPDLISLCESKHWSVIFVDDGSTDGSAQILSRWEAQPFVRVIHHKRNRGYGKALKSGILNATTSHVVTIDSDGQHNPADIEPVFNFALETGADLVVGDRGAWKSSSIFRELGKRLIRFCTSLLMPLPIRDLNSGFKLYRTVLSQNYLRICPDTMSFSDTITLVFISQRELVLEYPISVRKRFVGKSTIFIGTAFETIIEIVNIILLFNPLKIFIPASLLCVLLGFVWGLPIALLGRGVSVGAMLAIVLGAILLAIGLLASQLSSIRMGMLEKDQTKR